MLFLLSRRCKDSRHIVFLKHVIVHFFPSLLKYKCISESPEDELLFCDRSFMSCLFCLCFKTSLRSKPFIWKWNSLSHERFCTETRFEKRHKVIQECPMVQQPAYLFLSLFVRRYEGKNRVKKISTLERVSEMVHFRQECTDTSWGSSVLCESFSTIFSSRRVLFHLPVTCLPSIGSTSSGEEKRTHSSSITESRGRYNAAGPGSAFEMLRSGRGYFG